MEKEEKTTKSFLIKSLPISLSKKIDAMKVYYNQQKGSNINKEQTIVKMLGEYAEIRGIEIMTNNELH